MKRLIASVTLLLLLLTITFVARELRTNEPEPPQTTESSEEILGEQRHVEIEPRKNCRELGGYLCYEGGCALPWYDSSDSYCCPIECDTCPSDFPCYDGDRCTRDVCYVNNSVPICEFRRIAPCLNNGICEGGEMSTLVFYDLEATCQGEETRGGISAGMYADESNDCPSTCNDEDSGTLDYYDFDLQRCVNYRC